MQLLGELAGRACALGDRRRWMLLQLVFLADESGPCVGAAKGPSDDVVAGARAIVHAQPFEGRLVRILRWSPATPV